MNPDGLAIATTGLSKRFGRPGHGQLAVDGLDLVVPAGSVYGFLGPNGSGKTTTIRMLLGLVFATAGEISLLGQRIPDHAARALPHVGSLVEGPAFHPYLSGRANLARLDAADLGASRRDSGRRIDHALERVGLTAAAAKRYRNYSLGMRQRLGIAAALLQPRDLLILDEPTNGLDPQGTREVRHLVTQLAADGTTVFVSSHLLSEVEQVCDHVGVMRTGRLVWQGSLAVLGDQQRVRVVVQTPDSTVAKGVLADLGLVEINEEPGTASAVLGSRAPEDIVAALVRAGVAVRGFAVQRPNLEDVFVSLTGEGFDVSA
ncbi:ABC transporter ATP-binding protein [Jatrophihabitans telluris]|uniref:ABC transporter ATP-binding protein n=1 Tax=Jatrophihabitans telluris TaxID=2038343 RepID=A0ABY4R0I2_9ACTN|nr:ABC transporter ATP-binding protein [Jatrophihabitans telluris]UQX88636.1 ABC transporter ATP-binding protein [Jatrophihabitans telluris]